MTSTIRMRTAAQRNIACLLVLVLVIATFLITNWSMTTQDKKNPSQGFSRVTARKAPVTNSTNSDETDHGAAARSLEVKRRLKHLCSSFKPTEDVMWHMCLNRKLRLAYCFIPKVASRTLRRYLQTRVPPESSDDLSSYTRFMFVREPFGRLLSAYKDKFVNKDRLEEKWMQIERKLVPKGTSEESLISGKVLVSFKKFIEYIINDVNVKMNEINRHWKAFHEICLPCSYNYDFIGRYEFLSDDINYVRKLAKAEELKPFPITEESKTSSELISYYSQIPPKWIIRLGEIYQADFEMFGYPFPGPVKELVKDVL